MSALMSVHYGQAKSKNHGQMLEGWLLCLLTKTSLHW